MVITVACRTSTTVLRHSSSKECISATRTSSFVRTYSSSSHASAGSAHCQPANASSVRSVPTRSVPRIAYFHVSSTAGTPSVLSDNSPLPSDLVVLSCPHCGRFSCQRRQQGHADRDVVCPNCAYKTIQIAQTRGGLVSLYRRAAQAHSQNPNNVAPLNEMLRLHYDTSVPSVLFRGALSETSRRQTTTAASRAPSTAAPPTMTSTQTQKKQTPVRPAVAPKSPGYQRKGAGASRARLTRAGTRHK